MLIKSPRYWLGKKHTKEMIEKRSKVLKEQFASGRKQWNLGKRGLLIGEKNPAWKGGVTPTNTKIRQSADYKQWRKSVFARDNYTCQECNARSVIGERVVLNADHIKPFASHPDLRFDVNNGRTLCIECHRKTDTYARKTK